jgi:nucleoid DNA-binding protein
MDDLIKLVAEKTGISPEQAKTAVETVMGFVKEKLPPEFPNRSKE